jgi:hypothetical protein
VAFNDLRTSKQKLMRHAVLGVLAIVAVIGAVYL